jgi:aldose 1-epimerase
VTIPGDTHVTVDERLLPTGTEPVDGTKYDLREGRLLTQQPYDDAWTDRASRRRRHVAARVRAA